MAALCAICVACGAAPLTLVPESGGVRCVAFAPPRVASRSLCRKHWARIDAVVLQVSPPSFFSGSFLLFSLLPHEGCATLGSGIEEALGQDQRRCPADQPVLAAGCAAGCGAG